jgi:hypothetical protein
LRDLGYVEGRNVVIEHRDVEGKFERLPTLAAELVASRLMPSWPQPQSPWPPSKRRGPSRLSSLLLPIRLRAGSSPALRGRAATSRGCPTSPQNSSARVWNCSSRPFRGPVGSLSSGSQVASTKVPNGTS